MTKKITSNGIEIFTSEDDTSAKGLLDYVEKVVIHLEEDLDQTDGKFHLSIKMRFSPDRSPKHNISANGSTTQETKDKLAEILKRSVNGNSPHVTGSVRVDLIVEDI